MKLLFEEYGPQIINIKGIHNIVEDAISHLDYSPMHMNRENWMTFTQYWCDYASHTTSQQSEMHQDSLNLVFTNHSKEDVIYSLAVQE